ncbi:hypothetical protein B1759_17605 [Rubrivirga sp. SAORIC476]|uniref:glycosyltransferase n=1 Tax=Rubrivirga sp. SAORIC476 TaxID=1961794 RepID=UPI000BA8EB63|nr:glycosyltransferase [Rubrivirga sp. SAORIC476]PAP74761.1 hypothetical protein B1759_17605 [Rubrivirga sp. SAORIC476]
MTVALTVIIVGYLLVGVAVAGRLLTHRPPPVVPDADLPRAVIVVAARDEEACLGRCLEALRAQDYPADRLSIVVADDHSTDGTAEVVRDAAARDGIAISYVRVPDPTGALRGKAQALHTAFSASDAEVFLLTDADCAPVPTWARTLASGFADPAMGIHCGLARLMPRPDHPTDAIQALDWEYLIGVVSAAAEAGFPATGMGNNMAVRRAAYEAVGGYPALPFSVTEDFILVRAVAEAGWRVRFPMDRASRVWSLPAPSLAAAYDQRRRWARGGLSDNLWVLPVYAFVFAVHVLMVAGIVLQPRLGLAALGAMVLAVGMVLGVLRHRAGGRLRPWAILGTVAFQIAYFTTLPVVLLLRPRIGWKGRRL